MQRRKDATLGGLAEAEIGDVKKGFSEADKILEYEIQRAVNTPVGVEAMVCIAQWRGISRISGFTTSTTWRKFSVPKAHLRSHGTYKPLKADPQHADARHNRELVEQAMAAQQPPKQRQQGQGEGQEAYRPFKCVFCLLWSGHLLAACAVYMVLRMLVKRAPVA